MQNRIRLFPLAQHGASDEHDGHGTVTEQLVVEFPQAERLPFHLLVILSQAHDIQVADKVTRRPGGRVDEAVHLGLCVALFQAHIFDHQFHGVLIRHLAGLVRNVDDDARRAMQPPAQLMQAYLARVQVPALRLLGPRVEAQLVHQFLAVHRPALAEERRVEIDMWDAMVRRHMRELQVMPRERFVHGHREHRIIVVPAQLLGEFLRTAVR